MVKVMAKAGMKKKTTTKKYDVQGIEAHFSLLCALRGNFLLITFWYRAWQISSEIL